MSIPCPLLWSVLDHTIFSIVGRDLRQTYLPISHADQHSVPCCTPISLPCTLPPWACTRTSLTHAFFRASWMEVRPSLTKWPLTRLYPL